MEKEAGCVNKKELVKSLEKNYKNEVMNLQAESKSIGFAPVDNAYLHWFRGGYDCAVRQIEVGFIAFEEKPKI